MRRQSVAHPSRRRFRSEEIAEIGKEATLLERAFIARTMAAIGRWF
jgi:hypothetical protein